MEDGCCDQATRLAPSSSLVDLESPPSPVHGVVKHDAVALCRALWLHIQIAAQVHSTKREILVIRVIPLALLPSTPIGNLLQGRPLLLRDILRNVSEFSVSVVPKCDFCTPSIMTVQACARASNFLAFASRKLTQARTTSSLELNLASPSWQTSCLLGVSFCLRQSAVQGTLDLIDVTEKCTPHTASP